jgi:hypothetical protein
MRFLRLLAFKQLSAKTSWGRYNPGNPVELPVVASAKPPWLQTQPSVGTWGMWNTQY